MLSGNGHTERASQFRPQSPAQSFIVAVDSKQFILRNCDLMHIAR